MLKQRTLTSSFSLRGKGLHTGLDLTVTFHPAAESHGYKVRRTDLDGQPLIAAVATNVVDTTRGTVLAVGEARVSTVEHAMAALFAHGIDNCLIEVNGPEFPILDGSAKPYVDAIRRTGTTEQTADRKVYIVTQPIECHDERTGSSVTILPTTAGFSLDITVSYDSLILPSQTAALDDLSHFDDEISASRTFVFVREIEGLLHAGLIKGGDLDNAIVIYEREMSQDNFNKLADLLGVPHMDAHQLGYINHEPLVWPNECARHKLLDIIGDLALIGCRLQGHVVATRPGHTINNKFARHLRQALGLTE